MSFYCWHTHASRMGLIVQGTASLLHISLQMFGGKPTIVTVASGYNGAMGHLTLNGFR